MSHLTDEQFEDLMQGKNVRFTHLKNCIECRVQLAEKQALAFRLQSAFAGIKPTEQLAEHIRRKLNIGPVRLKYIRKRHLLNVFFLSRKWLSLASAAAAVLIIATSIIFLAEPDSAYGAKAELVKIHRDHLSADNRLYNQADPKKVEDYFKDKLGVSPIILRAEQGYSLRGCCLCRFKRKTAAGYVVATPHGRISIIVVNDRPLSLGMDRKIQQGKLVVWTGSFAGCNLAAVRIGYHSYCAVGEVPDKHLTELLVRLIPPLTN